MADRAHCLWIVFPRPGRLDPVALETGMLGGPGQPTRPAADFMRALDEARFVTPLLAITFTVGGGSLLFARTAPLGLVLLAPPVAVILGFHLFLSGQFI